MAASLAMRKSQLQLGLSSSLNMVAAEAEAKLPQKQGIVTILGSDAARSAASLRRTLSADMSSRKWLSQNGLLSPSSSPMKKIASSEEFSRCVISEYSSSTTDGEEDEDDGEARNEEKPAAAAAQVDIWSLIVSQSENKDKNEDKSVAPYIHPLVKRSASALSKKSLEVCTESLGSETGSDGFSSYPNSEVGDAEEEAQHHEQQQQRQQELQQQQQHQQQHFSDYEDVGVVKYNCAAAVGRKLPPPLPSLSSRGDGPSLRMRPHRVNGRLVLEAVSVSVQNNFKAERQDGRLILTFLNNDSSPQTEKEEETEYMEDHFGQNDDVFDCESEEEEEELKKESREIEISMEQSPIMRSGVIKHHRLALMVHKSASLAAMNTTYTPQVHKYNQVVQMQEKVRETDRTPPPLLAQSLPPLPPAARLLSSPSAATSFNAYDYCWRAKPTAAQAMEKNSNNKYIISKNNSSSIITNNDVIKGIKEDNYYLIQNLKGCKEHRRSLFWEPYCIATS